MRHDVLLAVGFVVIVVLYGAAAAVGLKVRRRIFAGPARGAWELTRHGLSKGDRWRVQWATMRRRPVGRAALALPQLVYSRYVQYTFERSPLHRRSFRIGFAVLYVAVAAIGFVVGAGHHHHHQSRVSDVVLGTLFAVCAVMWGPVVSWSLRRGPLRMKRLRRQVRERYPDDWALRIGVKVPGSARVGRGGGERVSPCVLPSRCRPCAGGLAGLGRRPVPGNTP